MESSIFSGNVAWQEGQCPIDLSRGTDRWGYAGGKQQRLSNMVNNPIVTAATEITLAEETLKTLDEIFPGTGR